MGAFNKACHLLALDADRLAYLDASISEEADGDLETLLARPKRELLLEDGERPSRCILSPKEPERERFPPPLPG